jgi:Cu(I)/Ag(I) efflux system membrane fusion protein
LSNSQIESIKTNSQISPYTTFYSTYSGYVSDFSHRGQLCYGGGPIIKVADLSNLWLETQVNVSYAKNLKVGQLAKFPLQITQILGYNQNHFY